MAEELSFGKKDIVNISIIVGIAIIIFLFYMFFSIGEYNMCHKLNGTMFKEGHKCLQIENISAVCVDGYRVIDDGIIIINNVKN